MPDPRTTVWFGQHAGARFRCRVCRRFVRATERGVCPSCGMPPPAFVSVTGAPDVEAARLRRRRLRWAAILLLEIALLAGLVYAALP